MAGSLFYITFAKWKILKTSLRFLHIFPTFLRYFRQREVILSTSYHPSYGEPGFSPSCPALHPSERRNLLSLCRSILLHGGKEGRKAFAYSVMAMMSLGGLGGTSKNDARISHPAVLRKHALQIIC
ncbi:hypothetical protein DSTSK_14310 [Desulforhabdus sp. TSK]|nr:hypothetical protein DSTSK_14310 [Desulforhabdus sp. TSK]